MYRVEEDVTETLPDGRTIQVATKGTDLPVAEARRLGLVKDDQTSGPSETKTTDADEPAAAKASPKAAAKE